jgi:prepilin-type N-terminal cleavage/methylation domain-containing protein
MRLASANHRQRSPVSRRGVTLLELLIVITILAMITAAAIPMMLSGVKERKIREAARLVSSYISSAKSRAIETGRPSGVMIQRFGNRPGVAFSLSCVEVPPPYSGDTTSSVVTVTTASLPVGVGQVNFSSVDSGAFALKAGDVIRFGNQGRNYLLLGSLQPTPYTPYTITVGPLPVVSGNVTSYIVAADNSWAPAPVSPSYTTTAGVSISGIPYQVFRQPAKSAVAPLQLPEGVAIDLFYSGSLQQGLFTSTSSPDTNPIMFTFNATGTLDYLYMFGQQAVRASGPLYFLIGRPEGAPDINQGGNVADNPYNVLDQNNIWVSIGNETGLVSSMPNVPTTSPSNPPVLADALYGWQYAQQLQSLGGR